MQEHTLLDPRKTSLYNIFNNGKSVATLYSQKLGTHQHITVLANARVMRACFFFFLNTFAKKEAAPTG